VEGRLRACRWECGRLVKGMQVEEWKVGLGHAGGNVEGG
jgi:hypothetical protein